MTDVSIIVVNYKTFALTRQCIDSVIEHTKGVRYEVILVENGTGEFDEEVVRQWGSVVKLVVSEQNLGFAGGNNLGIAKASGKYILLLNSDTYLKEDSVTLTMAFLEENPVAGVVSPRLVYPDGRHQGIAQRFPSLKYSLIELLRLQKLLGRKRAGRILLGAFFDHRETVAADWVWGAFFMIRRDVIQRMPGQKLDDAYFMYWEDVQWCLDVKRLGYAIYFFAGTEVVHLHQGSKGDKNTLMEASAKRFFERNYTAWHYQWIKTVNRWLRN